MSTSDQFQPLGATGLKIPPICFGSSGLGDMPDTYGYSVDEERALATVRAILQSSYAFIDTSRNYGSGRSEERIGKVLREADGIPADFILSTKLDRDPNSGKFDAARARRSLESSLTNLGVDHIQILHLHDPEHAASVDEIVQKGGALPELFKMKEEGLVDAIGLAAGQVDVMMPILEDWDFDVMITHNRFTLTNRNADPMIDYARSRGMAVLNAAPYAGGALAKGCDAHPRMTYQRASDKTLAPVRAVEEVCARHGVPAGAAALQFSLRDPRVASTVCGVSQPERVAQTLAWADWPIADVVWAELLALPYSTDDPEATRVYKAE